MSKVYKVVNSKYIHDLGIIHKGSHHNNQTLNEVVEAHAVMLSVANYKWSGVENKAYASGDYQAFTTRVFDSTPNYFTMKNSGLFVTNYNGFVKITLHMWLYSDYTDCRPWVQIMNYDSGECVGEYITSNCYYYQNICISDLVVACTVGLQFGVRVLTSNSRTFKVNAGSGRMTASYITLQRV